MEGLPWPESVLDGSSSSSLSGPAGGACGNPSRRRPPATTGLDSAPTDETRLLAKVTSGRITGRADRGNCRPTPEGVDRT